MRYLFYIIVCLIVLSNLRCYRPAISQKAVNLPSMETPRKQMASCYPVIDSFLNMARIEYQENENKELGDAYWMDSTSLVLENTYFENLRLKSLDGKFIDLEKSNKPKLIQLTATWCRGCKLIKPSVLKLAEEFRNEIDFILIYWDKEEELNNIKYESNEFVYIIPSIDRDENSHIKFENFNHKLGFPYNYFLDSNNLIIKAQVADLGISKEMTQEEIDGISYSRLKNNLIKLIRHSK